MHIDFVLHRLPPVGPEPALICRHGQDRAQFDPAVVLLNDLQLGSRLVEMEPLPKINRERHGTTRLQGYVVRLHALQHSSNAAAVTCALPGRSSQDNTDSVRDRPPPYARALVLDVDGVLTDRYARPDVAVVRELAAELSRGTAVGLVTGRSRSWLAAKILDPLSGLLSDARVAARLALACEFGAIYGRGVLPDTWGVAGPCVPRALAEAVRGRLEAYSDLLEWDATKECIATLEARHAQAKRYGPGAVAAALAEFGGAIEPLLATADCTARTSTYTLDVLPAALSKRVGARRVIDLLREDANLESAVVLGDSPGDVEIAEQALAEGLRDVEFVWLGEGEEPLQPPTVRLVRPRRPYSRGALLYLRSMRGA